MYGKPLISSEIGTGTSYININQQTGLVIPPGDAKLLEQAMRFLWNNPIIAEKLGEQAEKRYFEFFTAKLMASRYVDSYRLLLNEAQKRSRLFARQDKLD